MSEGIERDHIADQRHIDETESHHSRCGSQHQISIFLFLNKFLLKILTVLIQRITRLYYNCRSLGHVGRPRERHSRGIVQRERGEEHRL